MNNVYIHGNMDCALAIVASNKIDKAMVSLSICHLECVVLILSNLDKSIEIVVGIT